MWSPTTNTNTDSDNKKKENVEGGEGSFGATAVGAAALDAAAIAKNSVNNTNFKLNNFDNSKNKQQQQEYYEEACGGDSGFISGAISSAIIEEDSADLLQQQEKDRAPTSELIPKLTSLNIQSSANQLSEDKQQQKQQQEEENIALDSGCIVSEQLLSEDDQQQQKPVSHESSSSSKATVGGEASSVVANPMIFKQKVDANISEWFCNQNLPTDHSTTIGLNNLGARTTNQSQSQSQSRNTSSKQQTQQSVTATETATTTTGTINPSNAWERFYQQNDEGDTPLHIACAFGEEDIVAALIRMVPHPCLFNIQNDEGQTALHIAARAKQPKILRMLLIAGAEPTVRDCRGNTALHLACDAGEMQCVRALTMEITQSEINEAHRQYGHRSTDNTMSFLKFAQLPSDLEIRNYDGERCVHIAAQKGYLDVLRVLELFGADMNAKEGRSGYTPLHIAILYNNEEIINFLLNECKNLNLEAMTYAGRTAYQIADALEKYQMTKILKARGAEPLTPPDSDYDSSDLESDEEKEQDWFGDHQFFANYTLMVA